MDVQTQVMDEPMQVYSMEEIQNQAYLQECKDRLGEIRAFRISLAQEVNGRGAEIHELMTSRSSLIGMFQSEAQAMYPEIQGQDVFQVMSSMPDTSPLIQLWIQYKVKLDDLAITIKEKLAVLEDAQAQALSAAQDEQVVINQYTEFYNSAQSSTLPTPQALLADLQATQVIPYVEEGSVRAELPAIEVLDPGAAAMVMLQANEVAQEGDYSESPEQTETQENVQVRPMAFSYDEQAATPTLPQVAAIAPAVVAQLSDPAVANEKLKKYGVWFGVAAVIYLVIGDKKS